MTAAGVASAAGGRSDRDSARPGFPESSVARQWWVLTRRLLHSSVRNGELVIAILIPIVFTLGFYIPLKMVMSFPPLNPAHGMSSFAQFLTPLIVLQALAFTAISSAMRAANDAVDGINRRFRSMPLNPVVPLAARMSANLVRCVISLAAAIVCGYVVGFRFMLSGWHTVGFLVFAFAVGAVLCLGADLIGSLSSSPEATTQALALPQLILGMLSAGFLPVNQFPHWIQGFVRNQPISQAVFGMRALAGDSKPGAAGVANWATIAPGVIWLLALTAVFAPVSVYLSVRRTR